MKTIDIPSGSTLLTIIESGLISFYKLGDIPKATDLLTVKENGSVTFHKKYNVPAGADFLTIDETNSVTFYKRGSHLVVGDRTLPIAALLEFHNGEWIYK